MVGHASNAQLEKSAQALWDPLFQNPESSEEASRNVAASCLGKLTTTEPGRYLPLLQVRYEHRRICRGLNQLHQQRLHDPSSAIRATVISALRYTLADANQSYDELLAPLIVEFLSLMIDKDLVRAGYVTQSSF